MSIIEVQITVAKFQELIMGEINARALAWTTLPATVSGLPLFSDIGSRPLERIECVNCEVVPSGDGDRFLKVNPDLAFRYHPDGTLADLRAVGSLKPGPTATKLLSAPFTTLTFTTDVTSSGAVLNYSLDDFPDLHGSFALDLGSGLQPHSAGIVATTDVVAIRIGTAPADVKSVWGQASSRITAGDWIQLIPGDLLAEAVRGVFDPALDAAVKPEPDDPTKPWLPKKQQQFVLQKDKDATAMWLAGVGGLPGFGDFSTGVWAQGGILAVDACPFLNIDIAITLTLAVEFDFALGPALMRETATLTWDADSTWCDIVTGGGLGVVWGFVMTAYVESKVSDSILGRSLSPGSDFQEIGRTDSSITFSQIRATPVPSAWQLVHTHSEVTAEGLAMGGDLRPNQAPHLTGSVVTAESGLHIDCNIDAVTTIFVPAQVMLWNDAAGHVGLPPDILDIRFDPVDAWTIDRPTAIVDRSIPPYATALRFTDPPTRVNAHGIISGGRLAPGTATSVYLFTTFGVRWIDLGVVPQVPSKPPSWAQNLMKTHCGSIINPWARGLTRLVWVDPLVDPDYADGQVIDPVRLWTVALQQLPEGARLEFVAVGPDGAERLLGRVDGQQNAAVQLATGAEETLGLRSEDTFSAPSLEVSQSWLIPSMARPLEPGLLTMASAGGLLGLRESDGVTRIVDPRNPLVDVRYDASARPSADQHHDRVSDALDREAQRGRRAWSAAVRVDRDTVAVVHRDMLLIGTTRTPPAGMARGSDITPNRTT